MLTATVLTVAPLRYTPAGMPLLQMQLQHDSEQQEAGLNRKVQCQLPAVLIGDNAKLPLQSGDCIKVKGFLAQRSAKSTQVVLHIQQLQRIALIQN